MKRAIRLSLALCLSVGIGGGCQPAPEDSQAPPAEAASPAGAAITALGRLEPGLGVIELAAPAGDRIVSLEVREGEEVSAGQVLVVLESRRVRRAELELSQAARAEAEAHLRRARRVGPATVAAHEASVERLRAELRLSTRDLERTRRLVDEEVLPPRELDFQSSVADQAEAALAEAESRLEEARRRSRLDIASAEAALERSEAEAVASERRLENTELRSPIDGVVLDVRQFAGETTGARSILTLGEVAEMMAVAEVYETDARWIREGLRAEITSPALERPLRGVVASVGRLIRRNDVLSLDPSARTDVRVIEARIRLEEPRAAAALVHLQVDVRIETEPSETPPSPGQAPSSLGGE